MSEDGPHTRNVRLLLMGLKLN